MKDQQYMKLALKLAARGRGKTSPNPLVGAVIVKEGEIVGRGYHQKAGEPHAEINALKEAGERAKGATLYVTLEPCDHYGKTPPCTEAIIDSGLKRVVIAMEDPNPRVQGAGIKRLQATNLEVKVGVLAEQAKKLNEVFVKYITTKTPFVVLKNAVSLDGKIATRTGDTKWITGKQSRQIVHRLRDWLDGILVGRGTVAADNPRLTARLPEGGNDPTRIILDSKLEIGQQARVINQQSTAETIIATTKQADIEKKKQLEQVGVKILEAGEEQVDLSYLLDKLGELEITGLLVEGGGQVNTSFWEEELVDKLYYFLAPKIIGGEEAVPVVAGKGVAKVKDSIGIADKEIKEVGEDILITGYPEY